MTNSTAFDLPGQAPEQGMTAGKPSGHKPWRREHCLTAHAGQSTNRKKRVAVRSRDKRWKRLRRSCARKKASALPQEDGASTSGGRGLRSWGGGASSTCDLRSAAFSTRTAASSWFPVDLAYRRRAVAWRARYRLPNITRSPLEHPRANASRIRAEIVPTKRKKMFSGRPNGTARTR